MGVDTVDLEAAEAAGITVLNQPTYGTREVASHAVALLLALQRRLRGLDEFVRDGWTGSPVLAPMKPVDELVVGLVGCGRIGRATAEMLLPLVGQILAYDPAGPPLPEGVEPGRRAKGPARPFGRGVASPSADSPTAPEMVDEAFLAAMVPGALLVNVSRGGPRRRGCPLGGSRERAPGRRRARRFPDRTPPSNEPAADRSRTRSFRPTLPLVLGPVHVVTWPAGRWGTPYRWARSNHIEHGNVVVRG